MFIAQRMQPSWLWAALMLTGVASSASAAVLASDDFNRADSDTLGTTPVGGYAWQENGESGVPGRISISGNRALFSASAEMGAVLQGLSVKDLEAEVAMTRSTGNTTEWAGLLYRMTHTDATFNGARDGYYVIVNYNGNFGGFGPNEIAVFWSLSGAPLVEAALPAAPAVGEPHTLKVVANGPTHTIYWDGGQLAQFTDNTAGRNVPGFVGLGTYQTNLEHFDNFVVSDVIPEPALGGVVTLIGMLFHSRRSQRSRLD